MCKYTRRAFTSPCEYHKCNYYVMDCDQLCAKLTSVPCDFHVNRNWFQLRYTNTPVYHVNQTHSQPVLSSVISHAEYLTPCMELSNTGNKLQPPFKARLHLFYLHWKHPSYKRWLSCIFMLTHKNKLFKWLSLPSFKYVQCLDEDKETNTEPRLHARRYCK